MDFKKLISHIESIDGPIETPNAPKLADPIRLDEGTELRVLAGVTALTESVIAEKAVKEKKVEAKKAPKAKEAEVEEGFDADAKVGDKKKTQHGVMTKTATGVKHERKYGKDADSDDEPKAKKAKNEGIDAEAFKGKFSKMVEAKKGAKPDFADLDKDGDKKEPMKKAAKEAKGKKVDEAEEKRAPAKKTEREVTLPSGAKTKVTKVQGWQSQKADKEAKKRDESVKSTKKVVAESVEQKLSFKDMMKLVVESGGQQQIDPLDKELFAWASRVAKTKLGEGMKAEVYAGMVYERMGGVFQMYDVLSEDQE